MLRSIAVDVPTSTFVIKKILNGSNILIYLVIKNRKEMISEGLDILACSCFMQLSPQGITM